MKFYHFFWVFCFFFSLQTFAQTPEEENTARRVCVLNAINISDSSSPDEDALLQQYFKENLVFELSSAGFYIVDEVYWQQKQQEMKYSTQDLIDGPKAIAVAAAASADIVIIQFYHIKDNRITLGIKCYDVKTQTLAVQNIIDTRYGLNMASPINDFIAEMLPLIKKALEEVPEIGVDIVKDTFIEETVEVTEVIKKGNVVKLLLLSSDEGAEVSLVDEKMGVFREGRLEVDVQVNSRLQFDIRKPGYHLYILKIETSSENMEYSLKPLMKKTRWGLKLDYTFFQFVGLGVGGRYYFKPDVWGIELSDYPYFQLPVHEGGKVVMHNDTTLGIFVYPFISPSNFFRFSVGTGLGGIGTFFLDSGLPVFYDFFSEFGATFELNYANFILYLKLYGRYVFAFQNTGVLGTQLIPPVGQPYTLGVQFKW